MIPSRCLPATLLLWLSACTVQSLPRTGGGSADDVIGVGDACEQIEEIEITRGGTADVLLVVDRSGSMAQSLSGGPQKWYLMRQALDAVVTAYESEVQFGLMTFPSDDDCGAGEVVQPIAAGSGADIRAALDASKPETGATPTHLSIQAAQAYFAATPAGPAPRYALLATDGAPTCGAIDDDEAPAVAESVAAIAALAAAGVPTFVLGFGEDVNDAPDTLTQMAGAGQTGAYFAANTLDQLVTAFDSIASELGLPSCSFRLDTPAIDGEVAVSLDGVPLARDPLRADGWDYDATVNAVAFYGASCERIRAGEVTALSVGLGCGAGAEE